MALKRGEVNPLGVLGLRKLSFIPEHFGKFTTSAYIDFKLLDHWIVYNLNSRYAITKTFITDNNNKLVGVTEIGVEDPKELSMLTLGCPYLYNNNKDLI